MKSKPSKKSTLEHLVFDTTNESFFDNSVLDGADSDLLLLEQYPRIIDAAGICICLEGQIEITIGSQSYPIKKDDLGIIFPNDILYVRNKSADFKGYLLVCTTDFFQLLNIASGTSIYLYIKDNPCISLKDKDRESLIRMCDFLKEHDLRTEHLYRDEISKHLMFSIIYEVIGIYKKGEPLKQVPYSRKNQLYFNFMELLAKNYSMHRELEFYADKLCITSRHLSSICKEMKGQTAKECINSHLITNIKILLETTDMTISQISEELNFPNASFFTKFFKEQTKMTPKEYRNANVS